MACVWNASVMETAARLESAAFRIRPQTGLRSFQTTRFTDGPLGNERIILAKQAVNMQFFHIHS